jgi:hypothetical protein
MRCTTWLATYAGPYKQTLIESREYAKRKQALKDGIDLFADHEKAQVTAGDCLYGVSRGANDKKEAAEGRAAESRAPDTHPLSSST